MLEILISRRDDAEINHSQSRAGGERGRAVVVEWTYSASVAPRSFDNSQCCTRSVAPVSVPPRIHKYEQQYS